MKRRPVPLVCRFDEEECWHVDCSALHCKKQKFIRVLETFTPEDITEFAAIIERRQKGKQ